MTSTIGTIEKKTKQEMTSISKTLINKLRNNNVCPLQIKHQFIDKWQTEPTSSMLEGMYFEQQVIGVGKGHKTIELPKHKKTGEPLKNQKDLDKLAEYAKGIMKKKGIKITDGTVQKKIRSDGNVIVLDCIMKYKRKEAILELKYTGMALDKFEREWKYGIKYDYETQAAHFVKVYCDKHDKFLPFYFLIFGKDRWVKFIKVEITETGWTGHETNIEWTKNMFYEMESEGFPATSDYNKCVQCDFADRCESKLDVPNEEVIKL